MIKQVSFISYVLFLNPIRINFLHLFVTEVSKVYFWILETVSKVWQESGQQYWWSRGWSQSRWLLQCRDCCWLIQQHNRIHCSLIVCDTAGGWIQINKVIYFMVKYIVIWNIVWCNRMMTSLNEWFISVLFSGYNGSPTVLRCKFFSKLDLKLTADGDDLSWPRYNVQVKPFQNKNILQTLYLAFL